MIRKNNLTLILSILCSINCFGWGQKGHDVVAYIAEKHLTEKTMHAVDSILNGQSMVYWSNWLDNASHTSKYKYTKTWHYKNIDANQAFEDAPVHQQGDIVTALTTQIDILKSSTTIKQDAALALRMVIHLIGDLHQPMHMGHLSDLGGNKWPVKFFNRDNNLHSVWDSSILESAHKWSYTEWQNQIDRVTPELEKELVSGCVTDWAKETHELATTVYDKTEQGYNISYDYVAEWAPTIEIQLLKGGLRLAHILNSVYDSNNE